MTQKVWRFYGGGKVIFYKREKAYHSSILNDKKAVKEEEEDKKNLRKDLIVRGFRHYDTTQKWHIHFILRIHF